MTYRLTRITISLIAICCLLLALVSGGAAGRRVTNAAGAVEPATQAGEVLLSDSFERADSQQVGAPWQEAGEVAAEYVTGAGYHVGPARAEVNQGALSIRYSNHSLKPQFPFSSVNGRPVVSAPLARGVSARPVVLSFTFAPHPDNRAAHGAGLMSAARGFREAADGSGVSNYTPVEGFGVSFGRSSSAFNNSAVSIIKYESGTRTVLAERALGFQFTYRKTYTISLTVAADFSATLHVSDGVNGEQVSSPATSFPSPLDQFFIADIEGGISSDTRGTGDYSLRFDDVSVLETPAITPLPVVRLTNHPARDFQPAWSPDGSTIAFASNRIGGTGGHDVFAISPDGTGERLLARMDAPADGRFYGPSWLGQSGDLLVGELNHLWEIMRLRLTEAAANQALPVSRNVVNGDSDFMTHLMLVPSGQGAGGQVSSPDGTRIAWEAHIDPHTLPEAQQRYEVRVRAGGLTSAFGDTDKAGAALFRTEPGGFIGEESGTVAFSPAGDKVCITACPSGWTNGRRRDLFVINLADGATQRLTVSGEQGRDNVYVTWSSQNLIAFASRPGNAGNYDLHTVRPDGTNPSRLTDTTHNEITPSWDPTGTRLVFAADPANNYDLYVMDLNAAPTPTPTPTPTPSVTPLIFIPGITGSRLKKLGGEQEELWPGLGINPFAQAERHLLLSVNSSPDLNPYEVVREIGPLDFYKPLLGALRAGGYDEGGPQPTLFTLPYDWRKSNADNAVKLKDLVLQIRARYPNTKVNIVAHSMGGLVARSYILDAAARSEPHHVDKLVTIGTPWLGAPKVVNTLETGEFLDGIAGVVISKSILKRIVATFPGAHELIPSRAYFDLGFPFAERGWDINEDGVGGGNSLQLYDYQQMADLLDEKRFKSTRPAQTGRTFHDVVGQDDWRGRGHGVSYHHIFGKKLLADTIRQVVATSVEKCSGIIGINRKCAPTFFFDVRLGTGDGTVPLVSAMRCLRDDGGRCKPTPAPNYNESTAQLLQVSGRLTIPLPLFVDGADHVGMTQNPNVHEYILSVLGAAEQAARAQALQDDPPLTQQAYYLKVLGADSATLLDGADNRLDPLNERPGTSMPDVTSFVLALNSFLVVTPTGRSYTLTFTTGAEPAVIDLRKGTDIATAQATRYLDLDLPPSTQVRLQIAPEGEVTLNYDGDGDGTYETAVTPTASVSGPAAEDTEPPVLSISQSAQGSSTVVTLAANDAGSGVKAIYFSTDGENYQLYAGPVTVNPQGKAVLHAFADDNLANRSGVLSLKVDLPARRPARPRRKSTAQPRQGLSDRHGKYADMARERAPDRIHS